MNAFSFQNLDVWKRSSRLACDIYSELRNCRDYGLKDQITRSGLSIPSIVADKSAGATFERYVVGIGLEEVRYMDVPSKVKNVRL
jgi:hypothetical protein